MNTLNTNNTRQAAWVALGNLFSFMVGILSPMILSRFFTKGDYGTYKQVMYVYNTLLAVFTLGLPKAYAYFIPKFASQYSKDIIRKITRLFWLLGFSFSLLLYFGAIPISEILGNPELSLALKYFAPVPFCMLPTMGLDSICAAFQRTRTLAAYTITTRIFTVLCTVLPVLIWKGSYLYAILGFDFASIVTCLLALYVKRRLTIGIQSEISPLRVKVILSFSLPLLTASLWGVIISSSTQFFISRYYGNDVFADFSNGFMELPFVGMIIGAISTVLLPVFSKMDKGEGFSQDALNLWTSSLIKSAKIIFPMLIYCLFFAEIIMTCMYGNQYCDSSSYFIIKNIGGLFYIIPFAPIILAMGKTKEYSRVHMLVALMIITLEYLAILIFDSPIAVAVVGESCNVIKILLLSMIISRYANLPLMRLYSMKHLIHIFLCGVITASFVLILSKFLLFDKYVMLFTSLIVFLIVYSVVCRIFKISYKEIAGSFIPDKMKSILKFIP